ncbi:MAG: hypothetical protein Q7R33_09570 [Nitrosarchaeum sp.]|nr:hypothetical protein [Nitrosarchaeum sp.]
MSDCKYKLKDKVYSMKCPGQKEMPVDADIPPSFKAEDLNMKHLAVIQSEFLKVAEEWDSLSRDTQEKYLKEHPKSKRRLTAKPETKSQTELGDFDIQAKTVDVFFNNQRKFAKSYLENIGSVLKIAFPEAKLSDVEEIYGNDGYTVKFNEPVKIGTESFDINIKMNYPKIRCKHIESERVLDSQQPNSLIKKIKQTLQERASLNPKKGEVK